jgi:hypothetical protein
VLNRKRHRRWLVAGSLLAVAAFGYLVYGYRSVSNALQVAGETVDSQGRVGFESVTLDRHAPTGFAWVGGAASGYLDVTTFQDHLFLLNSSELIEYDADGIEQKRFRAGFELPPASLVAMTSGVTAQSKQPELLIATAGAGYLAYDGKAWRQVRMREKLLSIRVLGNGRVLLGAEKSGLLVHDARGLTLFHERLAKRRVTAIAGFDEASLWIGTMDEGLFRFQAGQLQPVTPVPDKRILCVEIDGTRVFVGTPLGIAEFEDGRYRRELASGFFVQTLSVQGKRLRAGTLEDGLLEISLDARNPKASLAEASTGEVRKLFRDFILTPSKLLAAGGREVMRAEASLLADGNISAISPDAAGRLWVGYFDRGLDIVDGTSAKHIEDDTIFCVNRIVQDSANRRVAVATGNGLALLDSNGVARRVLHKPEGLIANHATDVLLRPNGGLTIATPAGVTFLEQGQTSSLYTFHGLVNNHVYALGSCQGRLLAGTLGGASWIDGGLVRASFTTANSALRHNWITAIQDAGSTCLVGTYGAGVMAFDADGTWKTFPDFNGRGFEVNPNAMAVTARAAYAGSLGRGLAVWDRSNGRWNWVTEGLPSLNVTAVAARNGLIYVGTDNGLVKVDEQGLLR